MLYDEDDKKPNSKIDALVEKKKNEEARLKRAVDEKLHGSRVKNNENKRKNEQDEPGARSSEANKRKIEAGCSTGKKRKREKNQKPFDVLLRGVCIVISGIQNPDRANLRKIAVEMGAKYKPDWDTDCTHLM